MKRIFGAVTAIMLILSMISCGDAQFDQTTDKDELITKSYEIEKIEELKEDIASGDMTFSKFKRRFDVECIRKTHQGYYVLLSLKDKSEAYVFFDEEDALTDIMVFNGFKSKIEFQSQLVVQKSLSEITGLDPNTVFLQSSSVALTAHIVKEGVFVVKYAREEDGESLDDPIIISALFIENAALKDHSDPQIKGSVPFIFELDKVD